MPIFYRPQEGVAADFIPFYWDGRYHLFYLRDYRDKAKHGPGTPWFHLVTDDFVQFHDLGEALARGPAHAQDLWVFTGSVIEHTGIFHIFYTGHNSNFRGTGRPVEAIMHATSPDLLRWTKDAGFLFCAPEGYEKDDWRDPFVFWNEEAEEFWMLIAARKDHGPSRNRGCVALAASKDLKTWHVRQPFWAPDLYHTHECPDVFRMGQWWYLVYSTFSERFVTHYRMSRSPDGPWLAPANDTFDGRAYYAAKTAGDSERRFAFGWLATRSEDTDAGAWQWGGNLIVHELVQQPDGTLAVHAPETVLAQFHRPFRLAPRPVLGEWSIVGDRISASSIGRFSALTLGEMPRECLVEASMTYSAGTAACGVLLRAQEGLEGYYQVRLEPARGRLVLDRWPRPGDEPFMIERPLETSPGRAVKLRVIADGTCLVVYADDHVALSSRMYDHRSGALGLFVTEGEATFSDIFVKTRN